MLALRGEGEAGTAGAAAPGAGDTPGGAPAGDAAAAGELDAAMVVRGCLVGVSLRGEPCKRSRSRSCSWAAIRLCSRKASKAQQVVVWFGSG